MQSFDKLHEISKGLTKKYPNGNEPFQMVSALCEEAGELAKEVNHFEGTGIKREKYGEPNRENLAGEVIDVMTVVLRLAEYYSLYEEIESVLERRHAKLRPFINSKE